MTTERQETVAEILAEMRRAPYVPTVFARFAARIEAAYERELIVGLNAVAEKHAREIAELPEGANYLRAEEVRIIAELKAEVEEYKADRSGSEKP
mgnify:CR=1 FL=1